MKSGQLLRERLLYNRTYNKLLYLKIISTVIYLLEKRSTWVKPTLGIIFKLFPITNSVE